MRETRETDARPDIYAPPSNIDIPKGLVDHYKGLGFKLRWVRHLLDGKEDGVNISKRIRDGYQFVTKGELPEEYRDIFDTTKIRNNNQIVCVQDIVLAKIPLSKAKARENYYAEQAKQRLQAVRNEAKTNPDARIAKLVPVFDESESSTS